MRKSRLMIVAGMAGAVVLGLAPMAQAAQIATVGRNYAYVRFVSGHQLLGVCDEEADGNGVSAVVVATNSSVIWYGDANGSEAPCRTRHIWYGIDEFMVCESGGDCSDWVDTPVEP